MNNITQEHSQITRNKPSTAKGDTKFISRPGDNELDRHAYQDASEVWFLQIT